MKNRNRLRWVWIATLLSLCLLLGACQEPADPEESVDWRGDQLFGTLDHQEMARISELSADERLEAYGEMLSHPNSLYRSEGIEGLGDLGPLAMQYIPQLIAILNDENEGCGLGKTALSNLAHIGADDPIVLSILADYLVLYRSNLGTGTLSRYDGAGEDYRRVLFGLARVGRSQAAARELLAAELELAPSDARVFIEEAIVYMGQPTGEGLSELLTKLGDATVSNGGRLATNLWKEDVTQLVDVIPEAVAALESDDAYARQTAAIALYNIGPIVEALVPSAAEASLERLSLRKDFVTHFGIATAESQNIEIVPDEQVFVVTNIAVPALLVATGDEEELVREHSYKALLKYGPFAEAGLPQLIATVENQGPYCDYAARVIGEMGSMAESAIPSLQAALASTDTELGSNAAIALARIGGPAKETLREMRKLLRRVEGEQASNVVWAASVFGADAAFMVPEIMDQAEHGIEHAPHYALNALRQIGPAAEAALPRLAALFESGYSRGNRENTMFAIAAIDQDAFYTHSLLMDELEATDGDSVAVVLLLGKLSFDDEVVIPPLAEIAGNDQHRNQVIALEGLSFRSNPEVIPILANSLGSNRDRTTLIAATGLIRTYNLHPDWRKQILSEIELHERAAPG